MLGDMMAEYGGRLLVATSGVGLALIALVALLRFVRRHNGRLPFTLAGTRPAQQRLQVLESTVIDARRRLVLIRRDNVEHLILIGGPADVVIESDIASNSRPATPRAAAPALPALPPSPAALAPRSEPAPPPPHSRPRSTEPPPPAPLERPLPVTPHAAYVEASDDFAAPVETAKSEELRQAEAHIETMRRRVLALDEPAPTRPASTAANPASGFARVLDEEMKTPLHDTPRVRPDDKPQAEPDLQSEIARIFGKTP